MNTGTIYYHSTLNLTDYAATGTGDYPVFNPLNPTTNGWVPYTGTPIQPVNAIAVHYGSATQTGTQLCQSDGVQTVTISAQARDPLTDAYIPIGYDMPTHTFVSNIEGDNNRLDNTTHHTITTPGIDLSVQVTGDPEGAYPGTTPGADQSYAIDFANQGTELVCDVRLSFTIPTGLIPTTATAGLSNMSTLLTDASGQSVGLVDANGNPSSSTLPIALAHSGSVYTFTLGGTNAADTCLPTKAQGSVNLSFVVDEMLSDETQITTTARIREESDSNEIYLTNNVDTSSVRVYRANVFVNKKGYAGTTRGFTGSQTTATMGDIITYQLDYDNIGNASAENTTITDTLPEGVCLNTTDLESHIPTGASVIYYDSINQIITLPQS